MTATALHKYERLESLGRWSPGEGLPAREVIATLGEATLTLRAPADDEPLAQWSLPALRQTGRARFTPDGPEIPESLRTWVELDDSGMIEALVTLNHAVHGRPRRRGRVRRVMSVIGAGAMALALVAWLPWALAQYAARIAPPAQSGEVAQRVVAGLGPVCADPLGRDALAALAAQLSPDLRLIVQAQELDAPIALPGNVVLLGKNALPPEMQSATALGYTVLTTLARHDGNADLAAIIANAGLVETLRLLTGQSSDGTPLALPRALKGPVDAFATQEEFVAATAFSPLPEAERAILWQRYARPDGDAPTPAPLITDGAWVSLGQLCNTQIAPAPAAD